MIVDDSIFTRVVVQNILLKDPESRFDIVASAGNGEDALWKLQHQEIDVITLDIEMPGKNGLETLRDIMRIKPKPVVMLSSLTSHGAKSTIDALQLGAVDFILKPNDHHQLKEMQEEIYKKLAVAYRAKNFIPSETQKFRRYGEQGQNKQVTASSDLTHLIAIGVSTGGPVALRTLLHTLPDQFRGGIVIVQHMPEGGMIQSLVKSLDEICPLPVKEAQDGDEIKDGGVWVAPAGFHIEIYKRSGKYHTVLNKRENKTGFVPSVDYLFASMARLPNPPSMIGVILTGMGQDGSNAAHAIKQKGAILIAQNEKTCTVFGMPKKIIEKGLADYVEDIDRIGELLSKIVQKD